MPAPPFPVDQARLRPALHVKEPVLPPHAEREVLASRTTGPFNTLIGFVRTKRPPSNVEIDGLLARIQAAIAEYPARINGPSAVIPAMDTQHSNTLGSPEERDHSELSPGNALGHLAQQLQPLSLFSGSLSTTIFASAESKRRDARRRRKRRSKAHQRAIELIFDEFIALLGAIRLYMNEKNRDDILRECYDLFVKGREERERALEESKIRESPLLNHGANNQHPSTHHPLLSNQQSMLSNYSRDVTPESSTMPRNGGDSYFPAFQPAGGNKPINALQYDNSQNQQQQQQQQRRASSPNMVPAYRADMNSVASRTGMSSLPRGALADTSNEIGIEGMTRSRGRTSEQPQLQIQQPQGLTVTNPNPTRQSSRSPLSREIDEPSLAYSLSPTNGDTEESSPSRSPIGKPSGNAPDNRSAYSGVGKGDTASMASGMTDLKSESTTVAALNDGKNQLSNNIGDRPIGNAARFPKKQHKRYMSHFNFGRNSINNSPIANHTDASMPASMVGTPLGDMPPNSGMYSPTTPGNSLIGNTWQNIIKRKNMMMNGRRLPSYGFLSVNTGNKMNKSFPNRNFSEISMDTPIAPNDADLRVYLIKCITEMGIDELPKHSIVFCTMNCGRMMVTSNDFRYVSSRAWRSIHSSVLKVYRELSLEAVSQSTNTEDGRISAASSNKYSLEYHENLMQSTATVNAIPTGGLVSKIERIDPNTGKVTSVASHNDVTTSIKSAENLDDTSSASHGDTLKPVNPPKTRLSVVTNSNERLDEDNNASQHKLNGKENNSTVEDESDLSGSQNSVEEKDEFFDAEQDIAEDENSAGRSPTRNSNNRRSNRPTLATLHSPITEESETGSHSALNDSGLENVDTKSTLKSNNPKPIPQLVVNQHTEQDTFPKGVNGAKAKRTHSRHQSLESGFKPDPLQDVGSRGASGRTSREDNASARLDIKKGHNRRKSIMDSINKFIPAWAGSGAGSESVGSHSRHTSISDMDSNSELSYDLPPQKIAGPQQRSRSPALNTPGIIVDENGIPSITNTSQGIRASKSYTSDISILSQSEVRLEAALRDLQQDPRYLETMGAILSYIYQVWLIRFNTILTEDNQTAIGTSSLVDEAFAEKFTALLKLNDDDPYLPFYKKLRTLVERIVNENLGPLLNAWSRVRSNDMPILILALRVIFLGDEYMDPSRAAASAAANASETPSKNGYNDGLDSASVKGLNSGATSLSTSPVKKKTGILANNSGASTNHYGTFEATGSSSEKNNFRKITLALDKIRILMKDKDNHDLFRELIKAVLGFWNDPLTVKICKHIRQLHKLAPFKAILKLLRDFTTIFLPQVIENYRFISIPMEPINVKGFHIEFHDQIVVALENLFPGDIAFSGRWHDPRMGGDGAGLELSLSGIHVKFDDVKVSVKSQYLNWNGTVACLIGGEGITVSIRLKRVRIERKSHGHKAHNQHAHTSHKTHDRHHRSMSHASVTGGKLDHTPDITSPLSNIEETPTANPSYDKSDGGSKRGSTTSKKGRSSKTSKNNSTPSGKKFRIGNRNRNNKSSPAGTNVPMTATNSINTTTSGNTSYSLNTENDSLSKGSLGGKSTNESWDDNESAATDWSSHQQSNADATGTKGSLPGSSVDEIRNSVTPLANRLNGGSMATRPSSSNVTGKETDEDVASRQGVKWTDGKNTHSHSDSQRRTRTGSRVMSMTSGVSKVSVEDKAKASEHYYAMSRNKKERWVVKAKCKIPRSCMDVKLSGAYGFFLGMYAKAKLRDAVEHEVERRILKVCRVLGVFEDKSED